MKYIVDGKDLRAIANCVRNLNSSSESLTIDAIIAKLKELDDKQSIRRTYKITFNPINCETTGCHNSGINCSGWDLTEYNEAIADATTFVNADGYFGITPQWEIPAINHKLGSCIGDTCSGDNKCGNCHGGTAATPCSPITVTYAIERYKGTPVVFTLAGKTYKVPNNYTWYDATNILSAQGLSHTLTGGNAIYSGRKILNSSRVIQGWYDIIVNDNYSFAEVGEPT